jgi:hypothetical protein
MDRLWKTVAVEEFQELTRNFPKVTDEEREKLHSAEQVSGPNFEPETSQIQRRSTNYSTATHI